MILTTVIMRMKRRMTVVTIAIMIVIQVMTMKEFQMRKCQTWEVLIEAIVPIGRTPIVVAEKSSYADKTTVTVMVTHDLHTFIDLLAINIAMMRIKLMRTSSLLAKEFVRVPIRTKGRGIQ